MRNILRTIALLLVAAVCAGFAACSDEPAPAPGPQKTVIGHYTFDGNEYDICYGVYMEEESFYNFLFTPTAQGEKQHTVIMLSLGKYFQGRTIDVSHVYPNMDYVFSYDDPFYYYAPPYALKGGSILVQDNGDGDFVVKMEEIVLPDGKSFSLSFEGTLPDYYDYE